MANRKKRLQKGIESLDKQIMLHEEKLKRAEKEENVELAGYYRKEVSAKKKDKEEKQRILNKGG
ncbi:hypothetical protein HYT53_00490 [Candidatus Woesearchaeota archaeon]|nr:hypothetical protein [Candidatus Woesearchaeota archaeon]